MKNLQTKNISDLIYLEGSYIKNLSSQQLKEITNEYHQKLKEHEENILEKNLFLYHYRTPKIEDLQNDLTEEFTEPAIQPHDSEIKKIYVEKNQLLINGQGTSYMNYLDYDFSLRFSLRSELTIQFTEYNDFVKTSEEKISADVFQKKLPHLFFREVFAEKDNKINFIFIEYIDDKKNSGLITEDRNVVVISFQYEDISIDCKPYSIHKKSNQLK